VSDCPATRFAGPEHTPAGCRFAIAGIHPFKRTGSIPETNGTKKAVMLQPHIRVDVEKSKGYFAMAE